MFGKSLPPRPPIDPNVLEAFRRLGPGGVPMGNPLASQPSVPPIPSEMTNTHLPPNMGFPPMASGGQPGLLGSLLPPPNAPAQTAPGQRTAGSLVDLIGRTGGDWGDEPPTPTPLPSGRMVGSLVGPGTTTPNLAVTTPKIKPHFFDKNGAWKPVLGSVLDALAVVGGAQPGYWPGVQKRAELDRQLARQRFQDAIEREKLDWQKKKESRPEIRSVGRSVVSVPFEGDPSVLYSDPTEADRYAASLGHKPGEDGYADAVMDYVLKSSGPTAAGNRETLESLRYGNRKSLKAVPTYRDLHPRPTGKDRRSDPNRPPRSTSEAVAPILAKMARGEKLSPGEQAVISIYGRGRGTKPSTVPDLPRPTAPSPPQNRAAGPVRVRTVAEARALPPGTVFITPDGKQKVR